jgi:hypothetical protein
MPRYSLRRGSLLDPRGPLSQSRLPPSRRYNGSFELPVRLCATASTERRSPARDGLSAAAPAPRSPPAAHSAPDGSPGSFLHAVIGCTHVTAALRRIAMVSSALKEARTAIDRDRTNSPGRGTTGRPEIARSSSQIDGPIPTTEQAAWQRLGLFKMKLAAQLEPPSKPPVSSARQAAWHRLGLFDTTLASPSASPSGTTDAQHVSRDVDVPADPASGSDHHPLSKRAAKKKTLIDEQRLVLRDAEAELKSQCGPSPARTRWRLSEPAICSGGFAPRLAASARRDWPTSAPGLAHICAGTAHICA